jgi:hypothetical protein
VVALAGSLKPKQRAARWRRINRSDPGVPLAAEQIVPRPLKADSD